MLVNKGPGSTNGGELNVSPIWALCERTLEDEEDVLGGCRSQKCGSRGEDNFYCAVDESASLTMC